MSEYQRFTPYQMHRASLTMFISSVGWLKIVSSPNYFTYMVMFLICNVLNINLFSLYGYISGLSVIGDSGK